MAQKTTPKDDRSDRPETSHETDDDQTHTNADDDGDGALVTPGVEDSVRKIDTAQTRQQDDTSPFRHQYANARASDYSHDFQEDGSGVHPVKPIDAAQLDENGIPDIAETQRPGETEK